MSIAPPTIQMKDSVRKGTATKIVAKWLSDMFVSFKPSLMEQYCHNAIMCQALSENYFAWRLDTRQSLRHPHDMQKLSAYLARRKITPSKFAEEIGVPASTVTRLLQGTRRNTTLELMCKVSAGTGGKVTANDFAKEYMGDDSRK